MATDYGAYGARLESEAPSGAAECQPKRRKSLAFELPPTSSAENGRREFRLASQLCRNRRFDSSRGRKGNLASRAPTLIKWLEQHARFASRVPATGR